MRKAKVQVSIYQGFAPFDASVEGLHQEGAVGGRLEGCLQLLERPRTGKRAHHVFWPLGWQQRGLSGHC